MKDRGSLINLRFVILDNKFKILEIKIDYIFNSFILLFISMATIGSMHINKKTFGEVFVVNC